MKIKIKIPLEDLNANAQTTAKRLHESIKALSVKEKKKIVNGYNAMMGNEVAKAVNSLFATIGEFYEEYGTAGVFELLGGHDD
ncbi:MAG: hypothetical protein IJC72_00320 [Clostridia bacterium]|nr:hypothetical protein [Clostridia bacterium]MBQ4097727.1 hypothetical protein [Clostridia bacterium]